MILFLLFASAALGSVPDLLSAVQAENAATKGLRPGNGARIILAASPEKTSIAFVYLHGFSASPRESTPLVEDLAREFRANAYFPRYRGHGIAGSEGLRGVKLEDWEGETITALARARELGEKVVVVAMSTGAALSIPPLLKDPPAAAILISPSFKLAAWKAELLRLPFGGWLARQLIGDYREWGPVNERQGMYWTTRYPSEILVEPVRAAARARNAALEEWRIPTLVAYSPKDSVINPAEVEKAFARLGSSEKELLPIAEAGDPAEHVIAGQILSPKGNSRIERAASAFLNKIHLAGNHKGLRSK